MKKQSIILAASAFISLAAFGTGALAAEDRGKCPPYCSPGRDGGPGPSIEPPMARPDVPGGPDIGQPDSRPDKPRRRHDRDRRWNNGAWWFYNGGGYQRDYYPPRYNYYYSDPYAYDYGDEEYYLDQPVRRPVAGSCTRAAQVLRASGYRSVKATDCRGSTYSFRAIKNGKRYKVNVSARTGRIINRARI